MNTATAHETRKLIVIIGFMGSGKTTVAREVARLLNCRAVDLDELISQRENLSPGEIIEQSGEDEFRRIETETLSQVMNEEFGDSHARIVALGGGTWTLQRNRDLINEHMGTTIWLDAPFDLCWQRIQTGGEGRPLARDEAQARMLYAQRRSQYALAELQLQIGRNQSLAETCVEIVETLRTRNR
ncbi:MAG: AAA family ATPase [Pyrinomonadaceae bacterium]|nr:AAA family ATPase [Pyrinomonadaceae bacterium]